MTPAITLDAEARARVDAALRSARRLLSLGARQAAAALYLSVADDSRRLPEPRQDTPADEYAQIARGQRHDGHRDLALAILEAACRLTHVHASILYEFAESNAAAGHIDRALEMYAATVRQAPDFLEAHWERGVLLERRGQIDEALEAWRRSDLSRHAGRHALYLAAALKSPRSTNESLLLAQQQWARQHVAPRT
jgi:tetratricopeptide (TPR) repeat protein